MPSTTTELIKSRLDIVDFLRGYLTLTPAGKNFKALCPFHQREVAVVQHLAGAAAMALFWVRRWTATSLAS